ncbi:MAG: hypothetical protein ACOX9R_07865 [Armatimonadota bacterium]|jgi:hypothetical protein
MIGSMTAIEFTDNYEDLSDEDGFRFRFYCQRCDTDYASEMHPCPRQEETGLLRIVGKIFTDAADNGCDLTADEEEMQHDAALRSAVTEVSEHFHECPGCGDWICDVCWNRAMLLCEKCAPGGEH